MRLVSNVHWSSCFSKAIFTPQYYLVFFFLFVVMGVWRVYSVFFSFRDFQPMFVFFFHLYSNVLSPAHSAYSYFLVFHIFPSLNLNFLPLFFFLFDVGISPSCSTAIASLFVFSTSSFSESHYPTSPVPIAR